MAETQNDLRFEIINELGVLSESKKGWRKEPSRISWNGKEPIRHSKLGS